MLDGYELMMALVEAEAPHAPRLIPLGDLLEKLPQSRAFELNGVAVRLEYEDTNGKFSTRWVTIRSIDPGPPAKLNGHCHVKNRYRAFRADRIVSVSDEHGECCSGEDFMRAALVASARADEGGRAEYGDDEEIVAKAPQVRGQKKPLATGHGYAPPTNPKPPKKPKKAQRPQAAIPQAAARDPLPEPPPRKYPAWMWVGAALLWGVLCLLIGAALVGG